MGFDRRHAPPLFANLCWIGLHSVALISQASSSNSVALERVCSVMCLMILVDGGAYPSKREYVYGFLVQGYVAVRVYAQWE